MCVLYVSVSPPHCMCVCMCVYACVVVPKTTLGVDHQVMSTLFWQSAYVCIPRDVTQHPASLTWVTGM